MTTLLPGGDGPQLGPAVYRRFNRRRYDTAKTIDAFGVRLRDQVDLDTLSGELLAVVDQTMEPQGVPVASTLARAALKLNIARPTARQ
jgi:hypothetical protein